MVGVVGVLVAVVVVVVVVGIVRSEKVNSSSSWCMSSSTSSFEIL